MRILVSCLAVLALSMGCAGPTVNFDYDARASYAGYHAWDWYAAPKKAQAGQAPLLDTRVRRAVETQLAAKGFKREITADPEFLVTYYPVFTARRRSRGHVGIGLGFGGRGMGLGVGVAAPLNGGAPAGKITSIVLEIQDFKTHQLIWRAVAEDILDGTETPEDAEAAVNEAVKKQLDRFPPTAKS
jgi:hypothetical protein